MFGRSPAEARTEVTALPQEVWAVISDPTTYPDWLVGAQRIRDVDPSFPAPGSTFQHSVGASEGVSIDDSTTATRAEPPYRLGLEVHVGPFRADVELLVVPTSGGSEIRFRERPKGAWRVLTPVLRPALHARNAESLRRLEQHLEQPPASAPSGRRARAAAAAVVEEAKGAAPARRATTKRATTKQRATTEQASRQATSKGPSTTR